LHENENHKTGERSMKIGRGRFRAGGEGRELDGSWRGEIRGRRGN